MASLQAVAASSTGIFNDSALGRARGTGCNPGKINYVANGDIAY
jgi:hypothetical protein